MAFTVSAVSFGPWQQFGVPTVVTPEDTYVTQAKLRDAMSARVFLACFDDGNDGAVLNPCSQVNQVLRRAHAEVISYLPNLYSEIPDTSDYPLLLESAEIDYAFSLALDRRPELARTFTSENSDDRWKRAEKKMERIQKSMQRLTENVSPATPPNVGGTVRSGNPSAPTIVHTFIDGIGDF